MARRVAFFVDLAALGLAGLIASVPSVRGAEGSGSFVVISDLHFNPFDPTELATALAMSAPHSQTLMMVPPSKPWHINS